MALTGVADTRLLLTLQFPSNEEMRKRAEAAISRELAHRLIVPSIVLTEFIRIAGSRIGEKAALVRLNLLKERGARILAMDEQLAIAAGKLLLAHQNVPMADALISSFVVMGAAEYVVTDDPHYGTLGIRSRWL